MYLTISANDHAKQTVKTPILLRELSNTYNINHTTINLDKTCKNTKTGFDLTKPIMA